jgi:hypothetical protein
MSYAFAAFGRSALDWALGAPAFATTYVGKADTAADQQDVFV